MATTKAAWGSDVIVDMLQALDIDYIAINPGASYRGFHDSLVNYAEGKPEIVLCNHEGIAIAVAHGYAHAAGKMMAVAVHDVVGLLNATERNATVRVKDAVVSAVVRLCVQLEQSGLFYRDMKASNIMLADWTDQGGPLRTVLVDLDGLRSRRFWEGRRHWRSLVRLAASLIDAHGVTHSDFGRFLKAYLQQTGEPASSWKRRYATLGRAVEDYVRRARRRKRHKFDGYTRG